MTVSEPLAPASPPPSHGEELQQTEGPGRERKVYVMFHVDIYLSIMYKCIYIYRYTKIFLHSIGIQKNRCIYIRERERYIYIYIEIHIHVYIPYIYIDAYIYVYTNRDTYIHTYMHLKTYSYLHLQI